MTIFRNGAYVQGTTQNFTTSGSTQYSNVVGPNTSTIRVATSQNTWIQVGNATITNGNVSGNITANAGNAMLLPTGAVELFVAYPSNTQVAFLQVSTAGNISITELV